MSDAFWNYLLERERIRLRRAVGLPRERWTSDPIFREFSFTNVKRHHDRTTTLLMNEFYGPHQDRDATQILLNCAIARFFGTIEFTRAVGWSEAWSWLRREKVLEIATDRADRGLTMFTSAYIVPNCGDPRPKHEVVIDIIDEIALTATRVTNTHMWEVAADRLKECWGVGSFMAKEVLLDFVQTFRWQPSDWQSWTPVGPGARLGAGVVRDGVLTRVSESAALDVCLELYEQREEHWPKLLEYAPSLPPADNVTLDLTDIQFALCELAKYTKAATNNGRPKRQFRPTVDVVTAPTPLVHLP